MLTYLLCHFPKRRQRSFRDIERRGKRQAQIFFEYIGLTPSSLPCASISIDVAAAAAGGADGRVHPHQISLRLPGQEIGHWHEFRLILNRRREIVLPPPVLSHAQQSSAQDVENDGNEQTGCQDGHGHFLSPFLWTPDVVPDVGWRARSCLYLRAWGGERRRVLSASGHQQWWHGVTARENGVQVSREQAAATAQVSEEMDFRRRFHSSQTRLPTWSPRLYLCFLGLLTSHARA